MEGYGIIPIIIGSEANFIPEDQREIPELSHVWKCYVRAQPSLIQSVQFKLHESFVNHIKIAEFAPFEITEMGWGEFTINLKITLFNGEKVQTSHYLSLHADSYPHISERMDAIVYRGNQAKLDEEYNFKFQGEKEEYQQIDHAISYTLSLFDEMKTEKEDS